MRHLQNMRTPIRKYGRPRLNDTVIVPGGVRGTIIQAPRRAHDMTLVEISEGKAVAFNEKQITVVGRQRKATKWKAKPIHDMKTGRSYDSTSEKRRFDELEMLEKAGVITNLVYHPPATYLTANIYWRMDYSYTEDGRQVWEDWKPRPLERDELQKCKLWRVYGPGLLRITGRKTGTKTIMGMNNPGIDIDDPAQEKEP